MIVRARVTVRLDGVLLPRFPLVRRLDDTFLNAAPSTVIPALTTQILIPNTTAKRVRAVRAHAPVSVQSGGQGTSHAIPLGHQGLYLSFNENQLLDTDVRNARATPAIVDAYYAE